jgi:hypothetical protein
MGQGDQIRWHQAGVSRADEVIERLPDTHPGPPIMIRALTKAMIIAAVCVATTAYPQSNSTQLGCSGQLIEPTSKASSPKALQLTMSSGKVGVDFGDGNMRCHWMDRVLAAGQS